jgi:hypothetical protein
MPPRCRSKGRKALYKVAAIRPGARGPEDHTEDVATEEPAAGQPAT